MRTFTLIAFLLFSSFQLISQDYQFYFGGNHHISSTNKYSSESFLSYSYLLLTGSDSLYRRTINQVSRSSENKYVTAPGLLLGMNVDWALGNKLDLRSGIGVSTVTFKVENKSLGSEIVQIGEPDTVTLSLNPFGGGPTLNPCTFTNSSTDLAEPNMVPRYSLVTLQIPLKLNYHVNERLGIVIGGVLRTPIASNRKREYISLESSYDENGNRLCTYVFNKENDRTGSDFRDLTIQTELEIYYWLGNVGLSLGAGKMFTNLFVNERNSSFLQERLEARPVTAQFKVLYRFWGEG